MRTKPKIALFVGADVTAHIVLNRLIDDMLEDYEPIIFMPEHKSSSKALLPELKRFGYLDRGILTDAVYPYIESKRIYAPNRSPNMIAQDHGLRIESVPDVNDPAFVESLANEENLMVAVSIRCFQIFKPPIIEAMNKKGQFLNLHPGILPEYRGVMSAFRTMAANEKQHGWTLHKVEKEIDAGEILWVKAKPLDPSKSGYSVNLDIASIGAQSIMRALDELKDGNILKGYIQSPEDARYYTYPTRKELNEWEKNRIVLADADEVTGILVEKFSQAGTMHARELTSEIKRAVRAWEIENGMHLPDIAPRSRQSHTSSVGPSNPALSIAG